MSHSKPRELKQAEKLIEEGKFKDALKTINDFEEKGRLSLNDQISCDLLKSLSYQTYQIRINRSESLKFAEKAFLASQELGLEDSLQKLDIFVAMANALILNNKIDKSLEFIEKAKDLMTKLYQEPPKELKKRKAFLTFIIARVFSEKGDFKKALENAKEALVLRKEIGLNIYNLLSLLQIRLQYFKLGYFNEYLEYSKKALNLAEKLNHMQYIVHSNLSCGHAYSSQGILDKGLEYYNRSLILAKKGDYKRAIGASLASIGTIYQMQGKFDLAMKYLLKALLTCEEINDPNIIAVLDSLFSVSLDKKDVEQARHYLERIKVRKKSFHDDYAYRIDKARLLKTSFRTINRGKAEEILRKVISKADNEGQEMTYEMKIIAYTNLCDLLLIELQNTGELEVLEELQEIITKMIIIVEKNNDYLLLAEIYLLKARLASITFELKDARRYLTQAQQIAEKFGFNQLAIKISNEHDDLLKKIDMWNKLKISKASLKERMEFARLNEQMEIMLKKRSLEVPEISKEDPVMLLILTEGGNLLFSKKFKKDFSFEDDILGGFLTTVNYIISEVFSEGLDRAVFGQFTLLMMPLQPFLICYIYKGDSYYAHIKIKNFLDSLQNNNFIWQSLQNFLQKSKSVQLNDIPSLESKIVEIFEEKK